MRNVLSNIFKRGTLSFMSAVLAFSTLTPLLTAQTATAASNGPLTVESVCDTDGTVKLNFSLKQQGLLVGNLYYKTPYVDGNSDKHTLDFFDTDKWSVRTNLGTAPSVNVKAEVRGYIFNNLKHTYSVDTDALSCSKLNGENFNTVNSPYWGISVGFNVKDFGNVSAASVTIERAGGAPAVTKVASPELRGQMSNTTVKTQFTAPFIIQEGAFTEASDTLNWVPAPATWTDATTPVKAIISVTDQFGTKTAEITDFSQGSPSWPTYESLLPVVLDTVKVSPSAMNGWAVNTGMSDSNTAQSGGAVEFVAVENAPLSSGAVKMSTNDSNSARVRITKEVDINLSDLNTVSFDSKVLNAGSPYINASFRLAIDNDGNGSIDQWITYETYYNGTNLSNEWQTWNVKDGKFWGAWNPAGGYDSNKSLNEIPNTTSSSRVKAISIGLGNWNPSTDVLVDNLRFNNTIYDFEPGVVVQPENPTDNNGGNTGGTGNGSSAGSDRSSAPVFAVADIFGINDDEETTDSGLAALGTASNDKGGEVAGATDNKDDKGCGIFLGICWYYWIPIVLAILAAAYAVRRRLQANNA